MHTAIIVLDRAHAAGSLATVSHSLLVNVVVMVAVILAHPALVPVPNSRKNLAQALMILSAVRALVDSVFALTLVGNLSLLMSPLSLVEFSVVTVAVSTVSTVCTAVIIITVASTFTTTLAPKLVVT